MTLNMFLADDDADDRALFCEALEEIDPAILCLIATDGQQVLNKINEKQSALPDIIFLDINMPVKNGWYCLRRIKETNDWRDVPVIMYSTSSNQVDIDKALESGAFCFFTKPDDYVELVKSLKIIITWLQNGQVDLHAFDESPWFATARSVQR